MVGALAKAHEGAARTVVKQVAIKGPENPDQAAVGGRHLSRSIAGRRARLVAYRARRLAGRLAGSGTCRAVRRWRNNCGDRAEDDLERRAIGLLITHGSHLFMGCTVITILNAAGPGNRASVRPAPRAISACRCRKHTRQDGVYGRSLDHSGDIHLVLHRMREPLPARAETDGRDAQATHRHDPVG